LEFDIESEVLGVESGVGIPLSIKEKKE